MRNLVVVADTYPPKKDGVLTYLESVLPHLKEEYNITLIAPRFCEDKTALSPDIEVVLTRYLPTEVANYSPALPNSRLVRVIKKADMVFVNDLAPLGAASLMVAHVFNKPTVLFCHHDESLMLLGAFKLERRFIPKRRFRTIVDKIVFTYYRYADVIFVATNRFHRKLVRIEIPEEKIIFAPFAVDIERFSPANGKRARKKYDIPEDARVVLYLGRMSHEKNVETIIQSIPLVSAGMDEVYFVFAGGGARLEDYRSLTGEIAPHAHVIFTDTLEWTEVPQTYSMADLFVFPSLHETQAFVIMEAMASSLPVIVPREPRSYYSYYEENKNCVFLDDPRDSGELAQKILFLLNDDRLREELGVNARKKMTEFSWGNHVAKLMEGFVQAERKRERRKRRRIILDEKVRLRNLYNKIKVSYKKIQHLAIKK